MPSARIWSCMMPSISLFATRRGYHDLVASELPVLIISGERNPATPVTWGDEVRSTLPNSRHLVLPDAGHVPMTPCVLGLKQHLIETGSVDGLDTSCGGDKLQPQMDGDGRR